MSNDLLNKVKTICQENDILPKRSKGQNFLIDSEIYDLIADSAGIEKTNVVVEVGPGLGFLTKRLAVRAKKVIAVELDDRIAGYLNTRLSAENLENVQIINRDILKYDIGKFPPYYKVVANLPYNITSYFLRNILSSANKPSSMVLMLQKEVAERIVQKAPKMSLLGLSVQVYAKPRIIRQVSADSFWPVPKVDSAIITFEMESKINPTDEKAFFSLLKAGFSSKRKQLKNNLINSLNISGDTILSAFNELGIKSNTRAQEMNLDDWQRLLGLLKKFVL